MNKLWIEHSHFGADYARDYILHNSKDKLSNISILDTVGLFETCWMIRIHLNNSDRTYRYGYPSNE